MDFPSSRLLLEYSDTTPRFALFGDVCKVKISQSHRVPSTIHSHFEVNFVGVPKFEHLPSPDVFSAHLSSLLPQGVVLFCAKLMGATQTNSIKQFLEIGGTRKYHASSLFTKNQMI